jgi:hypothetical protein
MSDFLANFMQFALKQTNAERGLAVDTDLNTQSVVGLDAKAMSSQSFTDLTAKVLHDAITTQNPVMTNNIIADLSEAPKTNTSFTDLRMVVAIPVAQFGAIYIDRPIKFGVISRDLIEKITLFGNQLATSGATQLTVDEMIAQFGVAS